MNKKNFEKKVKELLIPGLAILELEKFKETAQLSVKNDEICVVNIICPGYQKRRDLGVEAFDFVRLSDDINECPNVILMVERFLALRKKIKEIEHRSKLRFVVILADVAILNYEELSKSQDVVMTMDRFYLSILEKYFKNANDVEFVKMSELSKEFKKIPINGVSLSISDLKLVLVQKDVAKKAREYCGSLVFERINKLRSSGEYKKTLLTSEVGRSQREVARFVKEYGLAGKAMSKLYNNPLILFTEPSGYMRGYFYNAYLPKEVRLPVLYLA